MADLPSLADRPVHALAEVAAIDRDVSTKPGRKGGPHQVPGRRQPVGCLAGRPVTLGQQLRGGLMSSVAARAADLTPCGNCGSDDVRLRARGSSGSRRTAQVVCARCSAHGELCVGGDAEAQAAKAWGHKPHVPPAPPAAKVVRDRVLVPEPTMQRDPLELIARMLVGGSFRIPTQGCSTRTMMTAADVAGAVGMMRDPVAKQTAIAVVQRAEGEALVALGRSVARRVFRSCLVMGGAAPLRIDDPADRWRMRLVLQDAINDLVWPERKVPAQAAAVAAKMRKAVYLQAYTIASGVLMGALESARQEFGRRIFT